jgi:hypothetical protein
MKANWQQGKTVPNNIYLILNLQSGIMARLAKKIISALKGKQSLKSDTSDTRSHSRSERPAIQPHGRARNESGPEEEETRIRISNDLYERQSI